MMIAQDQTHLKRILRRRASGQGGRSMDDRAYALEHIRQVIRHDVLYLDDLRVHRVPRFKELLELLDLRASRNANFNADGSGFKCWG